MRIRTTVFPLLLALVLMLSNTLVDAQQSPASNRVHLPLVSVAGGAPAKGDSSVALIDRAVADGTLDEQTGLLYKVYVAFGDDRLPTEYRSSLPSTTTAALSEASERLDQLRPDIRAAITPFLLPPNAPGSWDEQREGGQVGRKAVSGARASWVSLGDELEPRRPYRIWFRSGLREEETLRAALILAAMDNHIWPKITSLMGRPRPDGDFENNGAGPEFDIYLVRNQTEVVPYPGKGCSQNSAYLLVNTDYLDVEDLAAHVMLATLYGYKVGGCKQYEWLFNATATWGADLVYGDRQDEHLFAEDFLRKPEVSLEQSHTNGLATAGLLSDLTLDLDYAPAYLLPFYLARKAGDPGLVRAIWDKAANRDSLAAVNGAVPGTLKELWPAFALANWNRKPHDDYEQLDSLTERAKPTMERDLQLDALGQLTVPITTTDVPHLAARYYHFRIPDDAKGVSFYNGWTYDLQRTPEGAFFFDEAPESATRGAKVQALLKINGEWQPVQDWTARPLGFLCRDRRAERVEEMVLVVSNSEWQDRTHVLQPVGQPPMIALSNIGCHTWEGTATVTTTARERDWPSNGKTTITARTTWEPIEVPQGGDVSTITLYPYVFTARSGVSYAEVYERYVQGRNGPVLECGGTARGSGTVEDGRLRMGPVLLPDSPSARLYDGEGRTTLTLQMPGCENDAEEDREFAFFRLPPDAQFTVHPNGRIITGSWSEDCGDELSECTTSYSWEFIAKSEQ